MLWNAVLFHLDAVIGSIANCQAYGRRTDKQVGFTWGKFDLLLIWGLELITM